MGQAVPAQSAEINDEGAQILRDYFEGMLDLNEESKAAEDEVFGLKTDGNVQIEQADTYYAVTLPHLSIAAEGGAVFDIGVIALNAIPTEDPDFWKVSMALPTPMTGYNKDKEAVVSLDIGRQRLAGLWHMPGDNLVNYDLQYDNITLASADGDFKVSIPTFTGIQKLETADNKDLWSGPTDIRLSDMVVNVKGRDVFKAGLMRLHGETFDLSLSRYAAYMQKIKAISTDLEQEGQTPAQAMQGVSGIFGALYEFFTGAFNGFTSNLVLENVTFPMTDEVTDTPMQVSIERIAQGFDASGLTEDKTKLALRLGYSGMTYDPVPSEIHAVLPSSMQVSLGLENLPLREMLGLGLATLERSMESPEQAQSSGMMAVMSLPQMLTEAGTVLKIADTGLAGDQYALDIDGLAEMNAAAKMGGTARVRGVFAGLDYLVSTITRIADNAELPASQTERLRRALQAMAVLQMIGQEEQTGTGETVRVYNFELNAQGNMTLNGGDIGALMGGMAPPPAATTQEEEGQSL
jgi:hypothetical protein